jgi:demethylmacrocin O-methyltransferase
MALDVTTICKKYDTDKWKGEFPHSKVYDKLFAPFRDRPIALLEIGINRGGSLRVWEGYFPQASLYAIDIKRRCMQHVTPRTHVELVDQSDPDALRDFADQHGAFDIIIDDGSHMTSHQILSFDVLWPYVKPGGVYVVEDTRTSYDDRYIDSEMTTVEVFRSMIHEVNAMIKDRPEDTKDIESILFKQDMIVVTKR